MLRRLFCFWRYNRRGQCYKVRFAGKFPDGQRRMGHTVIMLADGWNKTPASDLRLMIYLQTGAIEVIVSGHQTL